MKINEIKARQRLCDAILILDCIEDDDLPEKFSDKLFENFDNLCDLLDEIDKELFPEKMVEDE